MTPIPVAFYAPLKDPDHPQPSGDRTMARLLLRALERAGFAPQLASSLRTREPRGDPARQEGIREASLAEAERLEARYAALPPEARPRLWFTYHCYYKAPDHLGPALAGRLGIPYAIAEPSHAPKRAGGAWALGHGAAERAIRAAHALFVLTANDRKSLAGLLGPDRRLVSLPPFIDIPARPAPPPRPEGVPRLLAVAMMREGDKLASYRLLADAMARIGDLPWSLDVVGDGPERPVVERLFAPLGDRVRFHGARHGAALQAFYDAADLLVWPAVNEAYGMVLLEAQAAGCPVVAGRFGGVADVIRDGDTGILAMPGDAEHFARSVAALLGDPERRRALGEAAARFVRTGRGLDGAAAILRATLLPLVESPTAAA